MFGFMVLGYTGLQCLIGIIWEPNDLSCLTHFIWLLLRSCWPVFASFVCKLQCIRLNKYCISCNEYSLFEVGIHCELAKWHFITPELLRYCLANIIRSIHENLGCRYESKIRGRTLKCWINSVMLRTMFTKKTHIYFRFPNLEILMSIIINNFTFEIIEVTRKRNRSLPSSRYASNLWCVPGCL
jgi:hypothetical protein